MDLNRFKPVAKSRLVCVLHFTDLLAQLNLLVLEGGGGEGGNMCEPKGYGFGFVRLWLIKGERFLRDQSWNKFWKLKYCGLRWIIVTCRALRRALPPRIQSVLPRTSCRIMNN